MSVSGLLSLFEQEMREMQRKLDQDAKLQEFFGVKGNRRVNVELEMREANRKLMQQEMIDKQLNDLESILDDIKVGLIRNDNLLL